MVRREDHVHLAVITDPRNWNLEGSKRDGRLSLSVENDRVLISADRVRDEIQLDAWVDACIGGECDGIVIIRISRRIFSQVWLAVERGGWT